MRDGSSRLPYNGTTLISLIPSSGYFQSNIIENERPQSIGVIICLATLLMGGKKHSVYGGNGLSIAYR